MKQPNHNSSLKFVSASSCLKKFPNTRSIEKRMERLGNLGIDMVEKSCINFDKNVKLLEADLQRLTCRASDVENEVTVAEGSGKKKRKRAVEDWLENVKKVKDDFTALKNRYQEQGILTNPLRGNHITELQTQVEGLLEQSQHFNELVLETTENRGMPRITSKLFGQLFKKNFDEILECLQFDNISMVGVYGMGGVGKTTLVKHIHNHLLKNTNFKVHWFTISQEFNLKRLQSQIAEDMKLDLKNVEDEDKRAFLLSSGLMKIKNLVITLDDVWERICLKNVGIPLGENGCKVILTSRSSELCDQMHCQRKIWMNTLASDDAWELFKYTLGPGTVLQVDTEKIAKSMVKRCDGLPLCIITMARSMTGVEDIHDWSDALEQLKSCQVAYNHLSKCQQNELVLDTTGNRGMQRITSKLFGQFFKKNLGEIVKCLQSDNISMVGVYGMGGVGKTTLVKHVHNHLLKNTNFKVHWFTISQEFNLKRLQSQIAEDMKLDLKNVEDEDKRAFLLSSGLMKIKNLVITLDDVWERICLKNVGIPHGENGCKVILTSRSLELCDQMHCQRKIWVNTLASDDAWELFKYTLGPETVLQVDTEKIAKSMVKRCDGLPLCIITMARSMTGVEDIHDWSDALEQLKSCQVAYNRLIKCQQNELVLDTTGNRGMQRITSKLFGQFFKKNFDEILQCLMIDNISMVGVYGMGGVGKTTLVEHVHNHLLENTNSRVHWFTISQEFNMKRLQNQIAKAIHLDLLNEEDEEISADMLSRGLMEIKNLVIILDDVWECICLKNVGIPHGENGCKVILTSRSSKLCDQMHCQRKFRVNTLDSDDAWELFKYTFGIGTVLQVPTQKIAKSMVKRCDGLPLGIVTMARSMTGVEDINEWSNALEQQKSSPLANSKVCQTLEWSYNHLSKCQQNCFLYCSFYPKGYLIPRITLIDDFISAGLLEKRGTRKEEFTQGHRILNVMVKVCLLKESHDRKCVKMHDLIRDMALWIISKDSMTAIRYHPIEGKKLTMHDRNIGNKGDGEANMVLIPKNIQEISVSKCVSSAKYLTDIFPQLKVLNDLVFCSIFSSFEDIEFLLRLSSITSSSEQQASISCAPLHSLEVLQLTGLPNLVGLIKWEPKVPSDCLPCGTFSNLKILLLWNDNKIWKLFPPWLLKNLQNLEVFSLAGCLNLEEVIAEDEMRGLELFSSRTITAVLPKLTTIQLADLTQLKSIYSGSMTFDSISEILVIGCPKLKRLPFSLPSINGQLSCPTNLKKIEGSEEWWQSLEWDNPSTKISLQPKFLPR